MTTRSRARTAAAAALLLLAACEARLPLQPEPDAGGGAAAALTIGTSQPWGGPSDEGRLLWFRPGAASVWRVAVTLGDELHLLGSRTFDQPTDWAAVGVAQNTLLWQRSDGTLSIWWLDASLALVRYAMRYDVPAGYRAAGIAVVTTDRPNPGSPPRPCFPDGSERYWILFRAPQPALPALIWTVDTHGNLVKQEYFGVHEDGWHPEYFGPDASGRIRMLWTRPSGEGRAHVWTVDRVLDLELDLNGRFRTVERWRRGAETWTLQPGSRMIATGMSPFVHPVGSRVSQHVLWTRPDQGEAQLWDMPDTTRLVSVKRPRPGGNWTARGYSDLRPRC